MTAPRSPASPDLRRRSRRIAQITLLTGTCLLAVAAFYVWKADFRRHDVVFRAGGCPSAAEVSYARGSQPGAHLRVNVPWESEHLSLRERDTLEFLVSDLECAAVHCETWVDGKRLVEHTGPTSVECGALWH